MKTSSICTLLCLLFLWPGDSHGQEHGMHSSAANPAPLGIMGSHTHARGSWMFSYQLMHMHMQGHLAGRENIGRETILRQYRMVPGNMSMQMHMLGSMYAATDKITLMGMLPYVSNHMEMTDRMGMPSKMHSSSIGDVSLHALYSIWKGHHQNLQLNLGVSIPTGSIREAVMTSHMQHAVSRCLPYRMQTGSGTWDLIPAISYAAMHGSFAYGIQGEGRLRSGENAKAYRLGNLTSLNGWLAYPQNHWLGYSLRLQALKSWRIQGQDAELDPRMSPAADTQNTGGQVVNAFIGTSCAIGKGMFEGHRLALEYGVPLYQDLKGIQMLGRNTVLLGWQAAF